VVRRARRVRRGAERLSARHRTLALDWRGHGESSSSEKDFGTRELVDDAAHVPQSSA
jgi:pimeloyl-ACP methyl ester carboxylesterase